jgi:hypothetical protein
MPWMALLFASTLQHALNARVPPTCGRMARHPAKPWRTTLCKAMAGAMHPSGARRGATQFMPGDRGLCVPVGRRVPTQLMESLWMHHAGSAHQCHHVWCCRASPGSPALTAHAHAEARRSHPPARPAQPPHGRIPGPQAACPAAPSLCSIREEDGGQLRHYYTTLKRPQQGQYRKWQPTLPGLAWSSLV